MKRIDLGCVSEGGCNGPKCPECGWLVSYIHIPTEWAPSENPSLLIDCPCGKVEFELLVDR